MGGIKVDILWSGNNIISAIHKRKHEQAIKINEMTALVNLPTYQGPESIGGGAVVLPT